ncbi:MAG: hypothetical protein QXT07_02315 [Archaeoglobaceae archaeon]
MRNSTYELSNENKISKLSNRKSSHSKNRESNVCRSKISECNESWTGGDLNPRPPPCQAKSKNSFKDLFSEKNREENLLSIKLDFSYKELEYYTKKRLEGLSKKSTDWIKIPSELLWKITEGIISYETIIRFRETTLKKWSSRDAWSKTLNFAKAFLKELSMMRLDPRYRYFDILLEVPKTVRERKRTTDRIITEEDIQNVIRMFIRKWKEGRISKERALTHISMTLFGAYTGQRPETITRLRVDQFEKALNLSPPVLLVEASQDKIRMEHYVPIHPKIIPILAKVVEIKKRNGANFIFDKNSYVHLIKRNPIILKYADLVKNPKRKCFSVGDLRKFAEQMADKIEWNVSNKNYILSHGVKSIDWERYKHPLPEFVYSVYMKYWKDVDIIPKEVYELL